MADLLTKILVTGNKAHWKNPVHQAVGFICDGKHPFTILDLTQRRGADTLFNREIWF